MIEADAVAKASRRFVALYDAHHAQVYAWAVSRVGRRVDDVVSYTFLVACRCVAGRKLALIPV